VRRTEVLDPVQTVRLSGGIESGDSCVTAGTVWAAVRFTALDAEHEPAVAAHQRYGRHRPRRRSDPGPRRELVERFVGYTSVRSRPTPPSAHALYSLIDRPLRGRPR
jgi:hypothetical protein